MKRIYLQEFKLARKGMHGSRACVVDSSSLLHSFVAQKLNDAVEIWFRVVEKNIL